MQSLPPDALQQVFGRLDYFSLFAAAATCRSFHGVAWPGSSLWECLCRRRWQGPLPSAALYPLQGGSGVAGGGTDWQRLFIQDCGWADPKLECQVHCSRQWEDVLSSLDAVPTETGALTVLLAGSRELQLLHLDAAPGAALTPVAAGKHARGVAQLQRFSSATAVDAGRRVVATGSTHGQLALYQLPPWEDASGPCEGTAQLLAASGPRPGALITQLQHLPGSQRLLALHDTMARLAPGPSQQRSSLLLTDAATLAVMHAATEVLEGYELAAVAAADAGGQELIGGSVKLSDAQQWGAPCGECDTTHPALCFHKGRSASAALCLFDARDRLAMSQRYATAHRSIYPRLQLVRQHFLLTSHAGTPLAVWDRRYMNAPVHEVQHLPTQLPPQQQLPLEHPEEHGAPSSQGLHLHANDNWVLGRADNGMMWLWDLSERLGWADSSHPGSWVQGLGAAGASWGDEADCDRCPLPLGCIAPPCDMGEESLRLYWEPPAAAWLGAAGILALTCVGQEAKEDMFPPDSPAPDPFVCNMAAMATLQRQPSEGPS